jgi:hypothetical protein
VLLVKKKRSINPLFVAATPRSFLIHHPSRDKFDNILNICFYFTISMVIRI